MVVDAHCHLGAGLPAAKLVGVMDQGGIDKCVLLAPAAERITPDQTDPAPRRAGGPNSRPKWVAPVCEPPLGLVARFRYQNQARDGLVRIGRAVFRAVAHPDNDSVAAAMAAHPGRFIGFASVNPTDPGHLVETDRCFRAGFRGVKVQAWLHRVDVRRQLPPLAKRCAEAGYPLLVHLGGNRRTGLGIMEVVDRFPSVSFIIAHGGIPYHQILWQAARTRANLFFDLAEPFLSARLVGQLASAVPPGRLLFGSGGPAGLRTAEGGHSYAAAKRRMEDCLAPRICPEAREGVFGATLLRLVGLAQPRECRSAAAGNRGGRYSSCRGR